MRWALARAAIGSGWLGCWGADLWGMGSMSVVWMVWIWFGAMVACWVMRGFSTGVVKLWWSCRRISWSANLAVSTEGL